MESKKTLILRIWQILERYSDEEHHLTQQDIIDLLYKDYGVECERKAVGRNISMLKEIGFDVESDAKGSYVSYRKFGDDELRILIDSVLCSRHISANYSKDLIDKLIELGSPGFKGHLKHVYSVKDLAKSENKDFFFNIDSVDEAIERGKKIIFDYNRIGMDKKPKSDGKHIASPYHMLLHNQHYYVMLRDDKYGKVGFYRLDKITNMQLLDEDAVPLKENEGFEDGKIRYKELTNSLPYMYSDRPKTITIKCAENMTDHLYDWFGDNFTVKSKSGDHFIATVLASEQAMLYWVLQYNLNVEVLSPATLRDTIKSTLDKMVGMYK